MDSSACPSTCPALVSPRQPQMRLMKTMKLMITTYVVDDTGNRIIDTWVLEIALFICKIVREVDCFETCMRWRAAFHRAMKANKELRGILESNLGRLIEDAKRAPCAPHMYLSLPPLLSGFRCSQAVVFVNTVCFSVVQCPWPSNASLTRHGRMGGYSYAHGSCKRSPVRRGDGCMCCCGVPHAQL